MQATDPKGPDGAFPSTHWSSIARAVAESKDGSRDALSRFLQRYLPVLRAYLTRWRGLNAEAAEDCLQGFIADRIVEKEILAVATPTRGRFRNFLLATLKNYLNTGIKRERQFRDRHRRMPFNREITLRDDPAFAFDFVWAQSVVDEALARMKHECIEHRRLDVWRVFEERVLLPAREGRPPTDYQTLIEELHLKNPIVASNLLVTAKRTYSRVLRSVVAEYAMDGIEVEAELKDLQAALAQAPSEVRDSFVEMVTG